ncbi:OPT family small oligopeptide transporter [Xylona heveae TC161]|uniref:OPT family small oligopeptide transporter n=1 Tax=Xylona heveae (strain CBS 132557 / TC161) TaxID=1328760 RepID=A0A165FNC1_XYLHT|nr:OPT family small oligopeptide transporter [Xylona heveae TC161]KZF21186.1 OPT family small oligopeptide transporter [Xylona heveae TC161]
MSQTPLLLRSSPAQGTGSYGALPIHEDPLDAGQSNHDDGRPSRGRRGKDQSDISRRGSEPVSQASSRLQRIDSRSWTGSTGRASGQSSSRQRRQQRKRRASISRAELQALADTHSDALEGIHESGLESRFAAGAGVPSVEAFDTSFDDRPSSSTGDVTSSETSDEEVIDMEDDGSEQDDAENPPDNSPYPQVRASVSAVDNITLSISTPRMWILSMMFALLGSSTNLFFSLRYPSVSITPVIALLLVHPLGLLWDQLLKRSDDPEEYFVDGVLQGRSPSAHSEWVPHDLRQPSDTAAPLSRVPTGEASPGPAHETSRPVTSSRRSWKRSLRLWLAQGRWNEKEHSCVYISSNVSFGFAFATDVIVEQTKFYNQDLGIVYQLLLTLSTQILGYTFAGLTRHYLVRPGGMIWPGTLMSTSMFRTLHKEENRIANGWRISRWKFFMIIWGASFAFYFLPGLLMPALSYFNVITWFAPKSPVIANLFGVASGLGLFPITFDWSQIAYIGSPLLTPFWAALNVVGGLVIVMYIMAPIFYYTNVMFSSYMPILSSVVFDNTGKPYDVSRILTKDFVFDNEAYHRYSRVFLPITYVLSYALQFAALTALITHTICWHSKDIWRQWKRSLQENRVDNKAEYQPVDPTARPDPDKNQLRRSLSSGNASDPGLDTLMSGEDVHCRLMRRYKDAPISWYLITFVTMTAIGIFVVEYYPIHLPWYGLLMALGIGAIFFIPIGIVMAITNQQSSLYLICQLICGVVFPGRPVANMVFVTYGYITSMQGLKFSSDLKLGHYMKIPPRILFWVQMAATIVSSLTQIGVLNWAFRNIPHICTPEAINGFTCPIARVHFNGSILWGVVGPRRFFGPGGMYRPLVWAFLFGAIAPLGVWLLGRKNRRSLWRRVNLPVLFGSLSWIPPATGLNFSVWTLTCYIFNHLIRRRAPAWWSKYTMTLSAALDSGLAFGVVVVFFGFAYTGIMEGFKWWGTEIYKQGCDWQACAYRTVPPGEHFGPDTW